MDKVSEFQSKMDELKKECLTLGAVMARMSLVGGQGMKAYETVAAAVNAFIAKTTRFIDELAKYDGPLDKYLEWVDDCTQMVLVVTMQARRVQESVREDTTG